MLLALSTLACGGGGSTVGGGSTIQPLPPSISAPPANATVILGQPVAFSVTAAGTPPLTYQWQRDGANLAGATSPVYSLSAAAKSDQGATFTVQVTNPAGVATSHPAALTVHWAPTLTSDLSSSLQTVVGQALIFSVVADANPAPAFQWQRNGVDLPNATASTLAVTIGPADQSASFRVLVSNSVANIASHSCTVSVGVSDIPITPRPHMDSATQAVYDQIRSRQGWLLGVDALGSAANPFVPVPTAQVQTRWAELYGSAAGLPASIEWEMGERNAPQLNRDWTSLKAFAQAGGLPWIMISMNNFTVPYAPGTPPQGGMNDTRNHAAGVLSGGSGNTAFLAYLRQLAQEIKAVGKPVVFRPFHEGNGGWFWWGGNAADFRTLWQLAFQVFQDEGVRNAIWLWAASDVCSGATCNALAFYPGDGSVDILGVDQYFNGSSLPANGKNTLALLQGIGLDKPIVIGELGPMARADYWQQAALELAGIPRFRGFSLWFARGWQVWGGNPSAGSLIDGSTDPATHAAFLAFLADARMIKLGTWAGP